MLLALQMPTWLVDFWTVYGDMITPVLVTLLVSIVTYLGVSIKAEAKKNKIKADLQIEALKQVANREDNKPQLEQQSAQISELSRCVSLLADMINVAFQNSSLDPEIKDNLSSLINKLKYGTEEDLVKELEAQKAALLEQINSLKEELSSKNSSVAQVTTTQETVKRVRR